jgi:hypothetical protein
MGLDETPAWVCDSADTIPSAAVVGETISTVMLGTSSCLANSRLEQYKGVVGYDRLARQWRQEMVYGFEAGQERKADTTPG